MFRYSALVLVIAAVVGFATDASAQPPPGVQVTATAGAANTGEVTGSVTWPPMPGAAKLEMKLVKYVNNIPTFVDGPVTFAPAAAGGGPNANVFGPKAAYPKGTVVWVQVNFYDAAGAQVGVSYSSTVVTVP